MLELYVKKGKGEKFCEFFEEKKWIEYYRLLGIQKGIFSGDGKRRNWK
jgi:hypothetical protein